MTKLDLTFDNTNHLTEQIKFFKFVKYTVLNPQVRKM